jgi:thioredoxin-like negative regulator of GroEL
MAGSRLQCALVASLFAGCSGATAGGEQASAPAGTTTAAVAATADGASSPSLPPPAAVSDPVAQPPSEQATELSWVEDDAGRALATARSEQKLLFVDVWAEWCHTCLSMQSYVLHDPSLVEFQRDYVFLQIDSDNPNNADFLTRFEVNVWPTFFVLDPDGREILGYWPGAGSLQEMRQLLRNSRDVRDALRQSDIADPVLRSFVAARSAQGEGKTQDAAKHFAAAYHHMPDDWPRRSELLLGYIRSLLKLGRFEECAKLGERHLREVSGAAIPIQFARRTFTCLGQTRLPNRSARVKRVLDHMRTIAYSAAPHMSFDDRADALDVYAATLREIGDGEAATRVQGDRLKLLETAAERAETPEQARTFDNARALAYVQTGRGQQAIDLLSERERQFPGSASPPSQLARVYQALNRMEDARAALERASARAQGQRKATLLGRTARLARELGETNAERKALNEQIRVLESLPGAVAREQQRTARSRLQQLGSP